MPELVCRAVVATAVEEVTDSIGCLYAGVEAQPYQVGPPSTRIGPVTFFIRACYRPVNLPAPCSAPREGILGSG